MTAAKVTGPNEVLSVEANPKMLPVIRQNFALNNMSDIRLLHGVVSTAAAENAQFYLRPAFWGSSQEPGANQEIEAVTVPILRLEDLIKDHNPTVIICDIEGAELDLFEDVNLGGVRFISVELHKGLYGSAGIMQVFESMHKHGFAYEPRASERSVINFIKVKNAPVAKPTRFSKVLKERVKFTLLRLRHRLRRHLH